MIIGITDNRTIEVVCRDHNKAMVTDIEHIETSLATSGGASIDQGEVLALARLFEVGLDKLLSNELGLAHADRIGIHHPDTENQSE